MSSCWIWWSKHVVRWGLTIWQSHLYSRCHHKLCMGVLMFLNKIQNVHHQPNWKGEWSYNCTCCIPHPHTEFSYVQPLTLVLACVAMVARTGSSSENQRIYQPFEWTSKCSLSWAQCSDWWLCVLQGQEYTLLIQAPLRNSEVEQSTVCSLGRHIVVLIEMWQLCSAASVWLNKTQIKFFSKEHVLFSNCNNVPFVKLTLKPSKMV